MVCDTGTSEHGRYRFPVLIRVAPRTNTPSKLNSFPCHNSRSGGEKEHLLSADSKIIINIFCTRTVCC